jgi:hypothetical protein
MGTVIARLSSGRRLVWLAAAVLLTQAVVVIAASPAQAATCTTKVHETSVQDTMSPLVRVKYDFAPECSDGNARVWGTVYDMACDNRAAEIRYWIYNKTSSGSYSQVDSGFANTDNGCGTNSTFSHTRTSPGSVGWRFKVQIRACNTWGCSTPGVLNYYG